MFKSAESIERLANRLARLPGIGRKSANRLALHILKLPQEDAIELADIIREVKEKVGFCGVCNNLSETDPCALCADPKRNRSVICVVEETADAAALEKAEGFNGLFHILGGRISPLDSITAEDLKIKELLRRLDGSVEEVILATNPTVEGEATAIYLAKLLNPLGVRVSRIARGLPVGADLEYADSATLTRALEGRQSIS